jgi:hypothetical protein
MEDPVIEADVAGNQWDNPFVRPGAVPVLPSGEDVRVGDMFVYPFNPDSYAVANSHPSEEMVYLTGLRLKFNAAQQSQSSVREHFATQHDICFKTVFPKIMADTADARNKQHPGGHVFR